MVTTSSKAPMIDTFGFNSEWCRSCRILLFWQFSYSTSRMKAEGIFLLTRKGGGTRRGGLEAVGVVGSRANAGSSGSSSSMRAFDPDIVDVAERVVQAHVVKKHSLSQPLCQSWPSFSSTPPPRTRAFALRPLRSMGVGSAPGARCRLPLPRRATLPLPQPPPPPPPPPHDDPKAFVRPCVGPSGPCLRACLAACTITTDPFSR